MDDPSLEGAVAVMLALPPLLADVAQDILEQDSAAHVVARLDAVADLSPERTVAAARDARASVVLLGVPHSRVASFCEALFDDQPRIKVLSIDEDGRGGSTTELTPHVMSLGELWPQRLVDAIHALAGHNWLEAWSA